MSLIIHDLEQSGPLSRSRVDAFLAEHVFPLVEGTSITFVYRGEASRVLLQHFIFGLPTSQPFHRIAETDLWYLVVEVPLASRIEYKLSVARGDQQKWIRDPLNPHLARDPFGANSVAHGEGYEIPDWVEPDEQARPGEIEEHSIASDALGAEVPYKLYFPARYRSSRRYPLLVVHDGDDYLRFSSFKTVLDNLIHRLEIAPMVVALTTSGNRLGEYADDPAHARFIAEELTPHLEEHYPLVARPDGRGLMGASFGGVAALSTAWRYPEMFGRLLLQSGSFAFTDIGREHARGPAFDPVVEFVNAFRDRPGQPSEKVFVSCGTYESLIYENRSLVPLLQETGMQVKYVEARDGHNWENWRDRLRQALSWLFPGPLWMIYE